PRFMSTPMRCMRCGCCARAASGHAAAAPPTKAMNVRRFTARGSRASNRKIAYLGTAGAFCAVGCPYRRDTFGAAQPQQSAPATGRRSHLGRHLPLISFRKTCVIRKVSFPEGAFPVKKPRIRRDPSTIVNRTVTPLRPPNADLREREYLTPKEVDRLQDAAR